jgi:hypothetical protein
VTPTKAPPASAVLEYHRCIAVTCTACGQSFNDDFTHHFASVPHALRIVTSEEWVLTATGVLCWSCIDDLDHDQRPAHTAAPLQSVNTAGRHCFPTPPGPMAAAAPTSPPRPHTSWCRWSRLPIPASNSTHA